MAEIRDLTAAAPPRQISPPTREIGGMVIGAPAGPLGAGWQSFVQEDEHVPELKWPRSNDIYTKMLTHPQVWALYSGTLLQLLEYEWALRRNDADPAYSEALAEDLGLPLIDEWPAEPVEYTGRGRYSFDWHEHLMELLFALVYGHYPFEIVAVIADNIAHLERMSPRHPLTITEVNQAPNGDLVNIRTEGMATAQQDRAGRARPIPADRLAYYRWWPDARNRWLGRSMLRALYMCWLVHPRLVRVDAINHERAGGVPWVSTDERYAGTDLTTLQAMAGAFRVGEDGGAAMPPGTALHIERPGGTSVVDSMRYHDELMARVWHAMVRQLGQTETGSRALGDQFGSLEALFRRAVARWVCAQFHRELIERWWAWNVPQAQLSDVPHPLLVHRAPAAEGTTEGPAASRFTYEEVPPEVPPEELPPVPEEGGGPPPVAAAGLPSPRHSGGAARRSRSKGRSDATRTPAEETDQGQARQCEDQPRPPQGADGAGVHLPERQVGGDQGRQGGGAGSRRAERQEDVGRPGAGAAYGARQGGREGRAPVARRGGPQDGAQADPQGLAAGQAQVERGRGWRSGGQQGALEHGAQGWADGGQRVTPSPQEEVDPLGYAMRLAAGAGRLPARELRREPTDAELRAQTDFRRIDAQYDTAAADAQRLLEDAWLPFLIAQATERLRQFGPGATADELARLSLDPPDFGPLADIMEAVAGVAAQGARAEVGEQGLALAPVDEFELRQRVEAHAAAVARLVADGVTLAASRKAAQLAGQGGDVAAGVEEYLRGLEHKWEADQLRGAVQQAQNGGRFAAFDGIPDEEPVRYYASELLDAATCEFCEAGDGEEYATLDAAIRVYPSGGRVDCLGGPRCRGTIVAVLAGES